MTNVAILGLGVVGGGVADLLTAGKCEVERLGKDEIAIRRILDLRDFPDSPFGKLVTHNIDDIINDEEIDTVIEVMGGSHPAYEFTVRALKAGKNVITSNKEVVAAYGDEFLTIAEEMGVSYRFEAAVGGGIPVISPLISCVRQNRLTEISGILNGTTNYILNKMFTYGDTFEAALKEAQEKGYTERNPDADILGIDTGRKIAILAAIATGELISPDEIPTEGIVKIRKEDVLAAEKIGCSIKLLGRCVIGDSTAIMVAPFMISKDTQLGSVAGVFNAVTAIGKPIGEVMFYGRGAGAGPTASAIVGDLMQIMRGSSMAPSFKRAKYDKAAFDAFECQNYFATEGIDKASICEIFGSVQFIESDGELAFVSARISEAKAKELSEMLSGVGAKILSRIRLY